MPEEIAKKYRTYMNDTLWYEIFKVLRQEFPEVGDKKLDKVAAAVVDAQVEFTFRKSRDKWGI